jgi:hypothetical protein
LFKVMLKAPHLGHEVAASVGKNFIRGLQSMKDSSGALDRFPSVHFSIMTAQSLHFRILALSTLSSHSRASWGHLPVTVNLGNRKIPFPVTSALHILRLHERAQDLPIYYATGIL